MENAGTLIIKSADLIWGTPILILLLGGGLYFLVFSRLAPLRYIGHALSILTGKYDDPNEPGQIGHYEALSTAFAGTVGMGNISGVAIAITMGGPGAIFWMWVSAIISLVDIAFALMAIPTVSAAVLLSPHVRSQAKSYFSRLRNNEFQTLNRTS